MIRDDRFGWSNLVCTTWGVIVEILLIAKKVTRHVVSSPTHAICKRRSPIILANTKDNKTNNIFCTLISLAKAARVSESGVGGTLLLRLRSGAPASKAWKCKIYILLTSLRCCGNDDDDKTFCDTNWEA